MSDRDTRTSAGKRESPKMSNAAIDRALDVLIDVFREHIEMTKALADAALLLKKFDVQRHDQEVMLTIEGTPIAIVTWRSRPSDCLLSYFERVEKVRDSIAVLKSEPRP